MFALGASILLGAVGYAVDVGLWEAAHRDMQDAADSGAISAIVGVEAGVDVTTQADAVAAGYNFVNGVAGATVTANSPPLSGSHVGDSKYVEVIVSRPQVHYFSVLFGTQPVNESARAVAGQTTNACILALDLTASGAVSAQGSVSVTANNCAIYSDSSSSSSISDGGSATMSASQIGAVGGFYGQSKMTAGAFTHGAALPDPYGYFSPPAFSGCDQNNFSVKSTKTIDPGVYCGGIDLGSKANVTMSSGIYYLDGGSLTINGQASVTGTGVTIVFTSSTPSVASSFATAKINGGATVNLTAPTTGSTAGFVLYGDRKMPLGTSYTLNGGSTQQFSGIIYFPQGALNYIGGASGTNGCTQIVADTISFGGNSNLSLNCPNLGIAKIGAIAQLVE